MDRITRGWEFGAWLLWFCASLLVLGLSAANAFEGYQEYHANGKQCLMLGGSVGVAGSNMFVSDGVYYCLVMRAGDSMSLPSGVCDAYCSPYRMSSVLVGLFMFMAALVVGLMEEFIVPSSLWIVFFIFMIMALLVIFSIVIV